MTETAHVTLSLNVADLPAQTISDAAIQEGLNVSQAAELAVRPDRDLLVLENHGSYAAFDLPAGARLTGIATGGTATVSASDAAWSGRVFRFADNPPALTRDQPFFCQVTVGNRTSPARIRPVSPDRPLPENEPFSDRLVLASGGTQYAIDLGNEFEDFEPGEPVTVEYESDPGERLSFEATVVSFDDSGRKTKYELAGPVGADAFGPNGDPLPPDDPAVAEIAGLLNASSVFEAGKTYSREGIRRRLKRLTRELGNSAFAVQPDVSWVEPGKSVALRLSVTAPLEDFHVRLIAAADTPPEWAESEAAGASVEALGRELENLLRRRAPLTLRSWENAFKDLDAYSRKSSEWEIQEARVGTAPDGSAVVACVVSPKAKSFSALVDGTRITSADLGERDRFTGTVAARDLGTEGARFFSALSARYAERGETLALWRDGRLEPLAPEYRKNGDVWELVVPTGTSLVSVKTPVTMEFAPPVDGAGRSRGPRPDEWLGWFADPDFPGLRTASAIAEGLKKLTRWYDERGYRLVGGHLDAEYGTDGVLRVGAKLYRLSEDVVLIPEGDGSDVAEKGEKRLAYVAREFRFRAGDFLNANDLAAAISAVGVRFHAIATPYVETDDAAGTAKLTVKLMSDGRGGLENLSLGGGYSGTGGFYVQAGEAFTTPDGFRNAASIALYPDSDLAGGGVSLSTPRDGNGGTSEISLSGQYYQDYISSLGASYNYLYPIGGTRWSLIAGGGAQALFSEGQAVEGTDALYFGPNVGIAYSDRGLSARLVAGPRVSTQGAIYVGVEGGVTKRFDLNEKRTLYAELYAKGGALIGGVPLAAQFHGVPVVLHGYYVQPPLEAKLYAVVGANLMQELPGGILDVGIGASAGVIGGTWSVGGGLKIRLKVLFPMTVTIGPALVDGVPTPVTVSLGP